MVDLWGICSAQLSGAPDTWHVLDGLMLGSVFYPFTALLSASVTSIVAAGWCCSLLQEVQRAQASQITSLQSLREVHTTHGELCGIASEVVTVGAVCIISFACIHAWITLSMPDYSHGCACAFCPDTSVMFCLQCTFSWELVCL